MLTWLSDQRGTTSLLVIDVNTGASEKIRVDRRSSGSPFRNPLSRRNRLYTHIGGGFFEFDLAGRSFTFTGDIPAHSAMGLMEDADGIIWAGLFPDAHLLSFNPRTNELTDQGSINAANWRQYTHNLAHDDHGWIYMSVGNTAGQVVAYNTATGEFTGSPPVRGCSANGCRISEPEVSSGWPHTGTGAGDAISGVCERRRLFPERGTSWSGCRPDLHIGDDEALPLLAQLASRLSRRDTTVSQDIGPNSNA